MKLFRNLCIIFLLSCFVACKKGENPWVPKSAIDSLISARNPMMNHVAVIYNQDIYYFPSIEQSPIRITQTPNVNKRMLSMSHNHKKFAFLNGSTIVIVDDKGAQLAELSQYSNVKGFDWSADDATLYILNNNTISYFGPSMNLPAITYPGINWATSPQVLSATVSSRGDFAYVFTAYHPFSPDPYKLVIKRADGRPDVVYTAEHNERLSYAAFSANDFDLVVGYKDNESDRSFGKLGIFTGLKNYPDFEMRFSSKYSSPRYNSKLNFMVCGYKSSSSDVFLLSARNFADLIDKSTNRDDFNNRDVLYTDWK
ncbi:hypothetical protein [Desertivirga brevis]|uniref:hypothetical protein n=1 Tax=Desertivirga brevis TaxID=2810310 RepID=UPI001A969FD7|nr:hypothetical protein [Pedobacter sp. SYSU D00873]